MKKLSNTEAELKKSVAYKKGVLLEYKNTELSLLISNVLHKLGDTACNERPIKQLFQKLLCHFGTLDGCAFQEVLVNIWIPPEKDFVGMFS